MEREHEAALRLVTDGEGLPVALVLLGGRLRRVPALSVEALRQDLARPELGAEAFSFTELRPLLLLSRSRMDTPLRNGLVMPPPGRA